MNKLCCILNPIVRCIGCDIPLCNTHYVGIQADNKIPKCRAHFYYVGWFKDIAGHAFDNPEQLSIDRAIEAEEKFREKNRLKKLLNE